MMTLDDVRTARDALRQQGRYPSQRAILSYLGGGGKDRLAKLLRQLEAEETAAAGQAVPPVRVAEEPCPAPRPPPAGPTCLIRLGRAAQALLDDGHTLEQVAALFTAEHVEEILGAPWSKSTVQRLALFRLNVEFGGVTGVLRLGR